MALGSLSDSGQVQFLDAAGKPYAGGKLYTYQAGSSTPLATYSDGGLTTVNANPVVLDSAGRAQVFRAAFAYKDVLTDAAGVTVWSVDNIYPPNYLDTSLSATNLSSGTVAIARLAAGVTTVVTTTVTGTQNNFAPGLSGNTIILCNNPSALTITGFAGGVAGQMLVLYGQNAQVNFVHQSASSSATNKLFNCATSGNTSITSTGFAAFIYDSVGAVWRLVEHEQGQWISGTGAAGDFTASAGTWTMGTITTSAYRLQGRTLTYQFYLTATNVSGTPATLTITNGEWGGFSAQGQFLNLLLYNDNGAGLAQGYMQVNNAATSFTLAKNTANWSVAVATTSVYGQFTFQVS